MLSAAITDDEDDEDDGPPPLEDFPEQPPPPAELPGHDGAAPYTSSSVAALALQPVMNAATLFVSEVLPHEDEVEIVYHLVEEEEESEIVYVIHDYGMKIMPAAGYGKHLGDTHFGARGLLVG